MSVSSSVKTSATSSSEIQRVRTFVPFQYEVQRFSLKFNLTEVGFEVTHNGATEQVRMCEEQKTRGMHEERSDEAL